MGEERDGIGWDGKDEGSREGEREVRGVGKGER